MCPFLRHHVGRPQVSENDHLRTVGPTPMELVHSAGRPASTADAELHASANDLSHVGVPGQAPAYAGIPATEPYQMSPGNCFPSPAGTFSKTRMAHTPPRVAPYATHRATEPEPSRTSVNVDAVANQLAARRVLEPFGGRHPNVGTLGQIDPNKRPVQALITEEEDDDLQEIPPEDDPGQGST